MNTNDPAAKYGKPMLSNDECFAMAFLYPPDAREEFIAMEVRDFYENLIHEGRLKVVEECRVKIDTSPGEWNGMHLLGCNGRGPVTDEVFCPYCGNRIIKPTNP